MMTPGRGFGLVCASTTTACTHARHATLPPHRSRAALASSHNNKTHCTQSAQTSEDVEEIRKLAWQPIGEGRDLRSTSVRWTMDGVGHGTPQPHANTTTRPFCLHQHLVQTPCQWQLKPTHSLRLLLPNASVGSVKRVYTWRPLRQRRGQPPQHSPPLLRAQFHSTALDPPPHPRALALLRQPHGPGRWVATAMHPWTVTHCNEALLYCTSAHTHGHIPGEPQSCGAPFG